MSQDSIIAPNPSDNSAAQALNLTTSRTETLDQAYGSKAQAQTIDVPTRHTDPNGVESLEPPQETSSEPPATQETPAPPEPTVTPAQYAKLLKAQRKLEKEAKMAQAIIDKAAALKGAFEPGADMMKNLALTGMAPAEIYAKMQEHALKEAEARRAQEPKDPVKEELSSVKKQLEEYKQEREAEKAKVQKEKDDAAHWDAITNKVAPVILNNQDKYETIITALGKGDVNKTIAIVYQEMWDHYVKTKEVVSPQQAADALEMLWEKEVVSSIENQMKLKKYSKYYNPPAQKDQQFASSFDNPANLSRPSNPALKSINKEPSKPNAASFANALAATKTPTNAQPDNQAQPTLTNNPAGSDPMSQHLANFLKRKGLA